MRPLFVLCALGGAALLCAGRANAEGDYHVTAEGSKSAVAPSSGLVTRTGSTTMIVRIYNSCFPTNLRAVANPLASNANIAADLTVAVGQARFHIYALYPAQTATEAGVSASSISNFVVSNVWPPADLTTAGQFMITDSFGTRMGGRAGAFGNAIQVDFPAPASATVKLDGTISQQNVGKASVEAYRFSQTVLSCDAQGKVSNPAHPELYSYPCGQYMGQNGEVSAKINGINVASDNSSIEIYAAFPGQTGFCGGYWSPLMLFFDDKRPAFSASSEFLFDGKGKTYWPEAGSPGYLLAIDRDGSGKIEHSNQLFGDMHGRANGFEALKALDANHDGKIDAADPDFNKLRLWQDKNGDGIAQADEISTLASHGIYQISVKYLDQARVLGPSAEERGVSEFRYKSKAGKSVKGQVIDIWLKPADSSRAAASVTEVEADSGDSVVGGWSDGRQLRPGTRFRLSK